MLAVQCQLIKALTVPPGQPRAPCCQGAPLHGETSHIDLHSRLLLLPQIQCSLQDVGSALATPRSSAREAHLSNSLSEPLCVYSEGPAGAGRSGGLLGCRVGPRQPGPQNLRGRGSGLEGAEPKGTGWFPRCSGRRASWLCPTPWLLRTHHVCVGAHPGAGAVDRQVLQPAAPSHSFHSACRYWAASSRGGCRPRPPL